MERRLLCFSILLGILLYLASPLAFASEVSDLKAEVEKLRHEISAREESKQLPIGAVDTAAAKHYGPDLEVKTWAPKLTVGGLVQVWYQAVQNDHLSVSKNPFNFPNTGGPARYLSETNESADNDTFRVRRTEIRFRAEVTEKVTAYVMLDPSREHSETYLPLPTFPRHNTVVGPLVDNKLPSTLLAQTGEILPRNVRPHVLQDAYIIFHDIVPHHTFKLGQFKPPVGEEALRDTGWLDFVDRAMVTSIANVRDLGASVSGTWLANDRVTYDFGLFNGPYGTILSDPEITEAGNRSDENDEKDFAWRVAVRPVWDLKKWYGRLELGYHRTDGVHGEAGAEFDPDFTLNAENLTRTAVNRQGAWAWYRPGGPVRGWWLRGEWGSGKDRFGFGANTSLLGLGSVDLGAKGPRGGSAFTQANPAPLVVQGWFFSTGYRVSDGVFGAGLAKGSRMQRELNRMEFAFRYEVYQNVTTEDLVQPDRHSDQFKTQVWTTGVNYYLRGQNAKIQANYLIVDDPDSKSHGLREVRNSVFAVNLQVSF